MKAFNRLSAGLCLSVFLFCPVHGVWGQGAGESSWQLKGLVDTYHAFRSEKPNDWMSSRTRLRGEVGKNFAGSSLFVSFNATYNALLKERTGFELREAYLDHRQEHWGFRLGRQLVIWGAADGVRITDLVSPMDMTEFLAQDYDDIRMPVNALRFFVFNDKIKLELLAVPTFEGYKLPTDAANPWSVLPKETPRSLVWDAEGSRPEPRCIRGTRCPSSSTNHRAPNLRFRPDTTAWDSSEAMSQSPWDSSCCAAKRPSTSGSISATYSKPPPPLKKDSTPSIGWWGPTGMPLMNGQ